jgi:hypothetical protein
MAKKKTIHIKRVEITAAIAEEIENAIADLIMADGHHGAYFAEAEKVWRKTGQSVRHFHVICDMVTELCCDRKWAGDSEWSRDWVETVLDDYTRIERRLDKLFVVKGRKRPYLWQICA